MTPEQTAAIKYYTPVALGADGKPTPLYVDGYGAGIKHEHWETIKNSGWFRYSHGSYILGPYEVWTMTEEGRRHLLENAND